MTLYDLIEDVCVLKSSAKVENGVTIESRSHKQKGQVFVAEVSKNVKIILAFLSSLCVKRYPNPCWLLERWGKPKDTGIDKIAMPLRQMIIYIRENCFSSPGHLTGVMQCIPSIKIPVANLKSSSCLCSFWLQMYVCTVNDIFSPFSEIWQR